MTAPTDVFVRFRTTAVRYALAVTAVGTPVAWYISLTALQGFLLGAVAGILGFWIMAVRLAKLAQTNPEKVHFFALTGTLWRYLLYGAALLRAYFLDRTTAHGLVAAAAGLLVIHFVLYYIGITGADQRGSPPEKDADTD